jgi:membrane associated rhomboid family serine protease
MGSEPTSRRNSLFPLILLGATVFVAVTTTSDVSDRGVAWVSFAAAWAVTGVLGYLVLSRALKRRRRRDTTRDSTRVRRIVYIVVPIALAVGLVLDRLPPIATVVAAAITSGFLAGAVAAVRWHEHQGLNRRK